MQKFLHFKSQGSGTHSGAKPTRQQWVCICAQPPPKPKKTAKDGEVVLTHRQWPPSFLSPEDVRCPFSIACTPQAEGGKAAAWWKVTQSCLEHTCNKVHNNSTWLQKCVLCLCFV